jgi:ribonucleoside-triphosphate reductase
LPYSEHTYQQAPYQDISKGEFLKAVADFPEVDFSLLPNFESDDNTEGAQTLACSGGACEIL